jgi:hypothetical protein
VRAAACSGARGYSGLEMREAVEQRSDVRSDVRFVPAGWLVTAFGASRLVLGHGKFGKLGIATLLWSLTPRKVKLVAAGFAAAALIVVLGALAAIALLALQLS